MEKNLNYKEEFSKRQQFLEEIKLTLEAEYNAPLKPEFAEDVDRDVVKKKFIKCIEKFKRNSNMTDEEILQMILKRVNDDRVINPKAKGEHDVLEEIAFDILMPEENIIDL